MTFMFAVDSPTKRQFLPMEREGWRRGCSAIQNCEAAWTTSLGVTRGCTSQTWLTEPLISRVLCREESWGQTRPNRKGRYHFLVVVPTTLGEDGTNHLHNMYLLKLVFSSKQKILVCSLGICPFTAKYTCIDWIHQVVRNVCITD